MTLTRNRYFGSILLAAALTACTAGMGCAGRVRIYDADHRDYHTWDNGEDRAYHRYWDERRESYREYNKLNRDQQNDYWKWRHEHSDRDDRR